MRRSLPVSIPIDVVVLSTANARAEKYGPANGAAVKVDRFHFMDGFAGDPNPWKTFPASGGKGSNDILHRYVGLLSIRQCDFEAIINHASSIMGCCRGNKRT